MPSLQQALQLHQQNRIDEAIDAYRYCIDNGNNGIAPYLNLGSLLRQANKPDEALLILQSGLEKYPSDPGLCLNIANCFLDQEQNESSIVYSLDAIKAQPENVQAYFTCFRALRSLGMNSSALNLLRSLLVHSKYGKNEFARVTMLLGEIVAEVAGNQFLGSSEKKSISETLMKLITLVGRVSGDIDFNTQLQHRLVGIQFMSTAGMMEDAIRGYYELKDMVDDTIRSGVLGPKQRLTKSFVKSWNVFSWNLSICLLKKGFLKEGWKLYEHGLQVPASERQRWQRSVKRPFSLEEISLWYGQSVKNKSILVLGEQGIGDSMMFLRLCRHLEVMGCKVTVLIDERIKKIYERSWGSMQYITLRNVTDGAVPSPDYFDFQIPAGSLPHMLNLCSKEQFHQYCPPLLRGNKANTARLREKYHSFAIKKGARKVVGISWQGGGIPKRIGLKSIGLSTLLPILRNPNCAFVSLQYGDDSSIINRFNAQHELNIYDDPTVDALTDMDMWLSQVEACDCVVSVANTTVHGSCGAGIPTFTFVSTKRDWRWIDPDISPGSYWYPEMVVGYQHSDQTWNRAINECLGWLDSMVKSFK